MANPCLRPRFTSDTPTESLCPRFAAARNSIAPITSDRASHGCSCCGKTLRTTTYREPRELGLNGSFAVFKKVETDVVGFEDFLQANKDKIDPELLAAKMCGRWRNGVPLALSPDTDSPAGRDIARPAERFRVCRCRWFGRSEGDPLSRRRTHTPRQSTRSTRRRPGATRRQQQLPPADSSRSAVRADL